MLNTTKVKSENTILRICCVRNEFTRLWSFIRCIRSPISLVSKKDIGNFKSLMKKSLTSEILMRSDMWSSSQRRMKSMAVRLTVSINCPKSINHIKPMFWFLIPTSTMDCVRKGRISCSRLPTSKPKTICPKCFPYFLT